VRRPACASAAERRCHAEQQRKAGVSRKGRLSPSTWHCHHNQRRLQSQHPPGPGCSDVPAAPSPAATWQQSARSATAHCIDAFMVVYVTQSGVSGEWWGPQPSPAEKAAGG
jgi:hypothetical protein